MEFDPTLEGLARWYRLECQRCNRDFPVKAASARAAFNYRGKCRVSGVRFLRHEIRRVTVSATGESWQVFTENALPAAWVPSADKLIRELK